MKDLLYALTCLGFTAMIGGAVYEHIAVVPKWSAAPPVSLSMFQGKYGLSPEGFWKFIHPFNLLCFIALCILHWKTPRMANIAPVFITYAAILVITFIYFVPELLQITGTPYSNTVDSSLVKRASLWETLSLVRLAVLLVIAMYLFLGLAKSAVKKEVITRKGEKVSAVTA